MNTATATMTGPDFPNLYGKAGDRRADLERKLNAAVKEGVIFSASIQDNGRYRLVSQAGTEEKNLTIREAGMLASFAFGAFREGRAGA